MKVHYTSIPLAEMRGWGWFFSLAASREFSGSYFAAMRTPLTQIHTSTLWLPPLLSHQPPSRGVNTLTRVCEYWKGNFLKTLLHTHWAFIFVAKEKAHVSNRWLQAAFKTEHIAIVCRNKNKFIFTGFRNAGLVLRQHAPPNSSLTPSPPGPLSFITFVSFTLRVSDVRSLDCRVFLVFRNI